MVFGMARVVAPPARFVERVHPAAIVEHDEKGVLVERRQVADHRDENILDAFLEQRASEMVVIGDVVALLWAPARPAPCACRGKCRSSWRSAPRIIWRFNATSRMPTVICVGRKILDGDRRSARLLRVVMSGSILFRRCCLPGMQRLHRRRRRCGISVAGRRGRCNAKPRQGRLGAQRLHPAMAKIAPALRQCVMVSISAWAAV